MSQSSGCVCSSELSQHMHETLSCVEARHRKDLMGRRRCRPRGERGLASAILVLRLLWKNAEAGRK